jgi:aspartate/methionine/tyrosine aminotransferase
MKNRLFAKDDYSEIQRTYFSRFVKQGRVDADPSGWLSTYSSAGEYLRLPQLSPDDFAKYRIDDADYLLKHKQHIARLLSEWEHDSISRNEFTLCPSGACASLVILVMLKRLGVKTILFETPAYFATIEQAQDLGLQVELLPTYKHDNYKLLNICGKLRHRQIALWVTQPRAALGFNQSVEDIIEFAKILAHRGYLVSDEVTDQTFPSHLRALKKAGSKLPVIRIRSFTKGMGLNGLRLAAILHPLNLRALIVDCLETCGGSIDTNSLLTVIELSRDVRRFQNMLAAAHAQVNHLRRRADILVAGSNLTINHLENGYIGSMIANLSGFGRTQQQRRSNLLSWCKKMRTPVILGSSFYMAQAPPTEAIRLNFFNRPEHIIRGLANILRMWI